jgi:hypothetical protein
MSLPIFTTAEDIDAIVGYLKTKPTGATTKEAKAVLQQTVDPRKLTALTFWGIISKDGDKIKLVTRGWDLARKTKSKEDVLKEVLDSVVPYRSALEWMYHQNFESVTNSDIAAHWHEHYSDALGSDNANTIKDQAVCFFRIVEAAGLGKMKIGRSGAPTRLEIQRENLQTYVEAGPTALPLSASIEDIETDEEEVVEETQEDKHDTAVKKFTRESIPDEPQKLRVFITHGKNLELLGQVEAILQLAEIDYEVAIKEETTAIPVPEKVFGAMRRCTAGLIIVSKEQVQGDTGTVQINPNVLIEIGAAFVLYDRRVLLLWEKGMSIPSNLQGLYRCEFEGKELGWAEGMKLMKALKEFRK